MSKHLFVSLSLVAILAFGFICCLQADEPKATMEEPQLTEEMAVEAETATPSEEESATPSEEKAAIPSEEESAAPSEEEPATPSEEEAATPGEEEAAEEETLREKVAEQLSVAERAIAIVRLKTLAKALRVAGLVEALRAEGPFTIFAPSDDAFEKLPEGALEKLLADREKLRLVLRYHVVPRRIAAEMASEFPTVQTLQGSELRIDTTDGVRVNNARVIESNLFGANGVIHVIDAVLLPEGVQCPGEEAEPEQSDY